jgi:hypothetical protein
VATIYFRRVLEYGLKKHLLGLPQKVNSGVRQYSLRMGDPMRQTIFTRKPEATLEENMDYVLSKIDYLLRKVEHYDRALNEFNEIKITIDEAKENTRKSKDLIREIKGSIDLHTRDLKCLSDFANSLLERIENGLEFVKARIDDLDERSYLDDECLRLKIEDVEAGIHKDLELYLDIDDLEDIKETIEQKNRYFELLITNVHHNYLNVDRQLSVLNQSDLESKADRLSMHKDLCRFQNALVRKGVPIDVQ